LRKASAVDARDDRNWFRHPGRFVAPPLKPEASANHPPILRLLQRQICYAEREVDPDLAFDR
jgi:hypothetical protein